MNDLTQPEAARNEIPILFDADIDHRADMATLVGVCDRAVVADTKGALTSPPRHVVRFDKGGIAFTTGGMDDVLGFRAYDLMPGSHQDQVVAVWSAVTKRLRGLIVGSQLGAYRTGALGGVAINRLAPATAATCAVIGTGRQATTQVLAAAAVRNLQQVWCYSRSDLHRTQLAQEMEERLGVPVTAAASVDQAVADAEIVILATSSTTPVVTAELLLPTAHVTTVGPKFIDHHELDAQLVDAAWTIATDSPQQIEAHGDRFFVQNTTTRERIAHLGAIDVRNTDRSGRSVYLSAGLAGTEAMVAHALIDQPDPQR